MKPILCALDFSESSTDAMKAALEMAARFETHVMVLFAYRLVQTNGALAEYRKNMEAASLQKFETLMSKLSLKDSVPYEFRSEIGFLTDRLEVYDAQNKIGLMVMSQDMINSIDEQKGISMRDFVRTIKTPLLIVPHVK
jgi:hypothetical protein